MFNNVYKKKKLLLSRCRPLLGLITPNRKFLRWGFDNKHLQVSKMGLCFQQNGLNGVF